MYTNFRVAPCRDQIRTDPNCDFSVARHRATQSDTSVRENRPLGGSTGLAFAFTDRAV
jgi:hypothetical protein